jgi:hypothetical protein
MAWCKLEDTYHDDAKFRRLASLLKLGERLGEERGMALAQGFVSRLWSWAARHAPDGCVQIFSGQPAAGTLVDGVSDADLERVAGWPNAGGRLIGGMLAAGFIDESADGPRVVRTIHRYWERAESHKAARRKKKQREQKSDVPGQSRDDAESSHGDVSLRGEERRGEREERRGDIPPNPPQGGTVREVDTSASRKSKVLEPFVIAEYRRLCIEHDRPLPDAAGRDDERAAGVILQKYAKGERWKQILRDYVSNEFYGCYGWSIVALAKHLDAIANRKKAAEVVPGKRAEIRDWDELQAEREAEWQRQLDEEQAVPR